MANTTWALDPTHSQVEFKVKHLMISSVTGKFTDFKGTVETAGNDFSNAKVRFSATIDSISTSNEQRDAHLKNDDFFDAANHPELTFESTRFEKIDEEEFKLTGNLTLKGVTRPVTLKVENGGITTDPWGGTRAGFSVTGKINRTDFGVKYSMVSETGGILLGEEVKLYADVQFVKQAVAEAILA